MTTKHLLMLAAALLVSACVAYSEVKFQEKHGTHATRERVVDELKPDYVDYWNDVKPVIENRCVVCHGCYDAPCQLKLSSIEGIERGATTAVVYRQSRIRRAPTTRLFEDAQTVDEWRDKGFHPVLNEYGDSAEANRMASIMHRILTLKDENPLPASKLLPDSFDLDISRKHFCAKPSTFDKYAEKNPLWGMPYALPAIATDEQTMLLKWLEQGATYTERTPLAAEFVDKVEQWEKFLNGDSLKEQLAARYVYEHLFLTHIYFPDLDKRTFFRLVRSSTPPGQPVDVIATRRPYNDPETDRVYYRITPELGVIVTKTHMPYALTAKRMENWQTWFKDAAYEVNEMPSYDPAIASNPFRTFDDIPVASRYRFLLDEARNTINSFIKGPVCRGQVALNVINDHFWVFFVDPDDPRLEILEDFLANQLENMELPASTENIYNPISHWRRYSKQQKALISAADDYLSDNYTGTRSITLDAVWDGNGDNQNAALTIFRHFDSATVEKGLIGEEPKTAWLIGFALLERIHYSLAAGYDVYGNVGHQLLTRVYMDFLRMEGESGFLFLLPQEARARERAYWYREADEEILDFLVLPSFESKLGVGLDYQTNDEKGELYAKLHDHLRPVLATSHDLAKLGNDDISSSLAPLEDLMGRSVTLVPQVVFVEIRGDDKSHYITIIRNNAHLNITSMFGEKKYRIPEEDTLSVVAGFIGSYPNALWVVEEDKLEHFVAVLSALENEADYEDLVDEFGVRRTNADFWQHSDSVHSAYQTLSPVEYGLFDLNRLENR